ncbi:Carboxyvinyl-carboxyphosphonate phosphorylmutase [Citrus sinensis]|nr:Carboxyvinyl-carboxyphosphonate phosphorylmutase [Citrus sinensis]
MKRKIEASIWLNKSMFGIDILRFLIRCFCVCGVESVLCYFHASDTGGGNALNVQRTVKDLVAAGAAGCFLEARADASFVEAPRNDNELKQIGCQTKGYRVCNMLEALYASARALVDVLKTLKESGTTRDHLEKMGTFEEFNQLVNLESWTTKFTDHQVSTSIICLKRKQNQYSPNKEFTGELTMALVSHTAQGRGSARCATIMAALLICLLLVYIEIVDATTYTVGDSGGWSFNMASWAKGKRFKAGDTLAVNRAGYRSCTAPGGAKVYSSGKDRIKLVRGQNFFICNSAGHCGSGMKIAINAM